jgi:hypothetical protein
MRLLQILATTAPTDAFYWTKTDWIVVSVLLGVWLFLLMTRRAPEIGVIRDFVNIVNSRGGNIVVLGLFSAYFFQATMRLFYYAFELLQAGQLKDNNAILLMALQFCTTSAFAGSFGAMLKTMTGSDMMQRITDPNSNGNGNGSVPPVVDPPPAPIPPTPTA